MFIQHLKRLVPLTVESAPPSHQEKTTLRDIAHMINSFSVAHRAKARVPLILGTASTAEEDCGGQNHMDVHLVRLWNGIP